MLDDSVCGMAVVELSPFKHQRAKRDNPTIKLFFIPAKFPYSFKALIILLNLKGYFNSSQCQKA